MGANPVPSLEMPNLARRFEEAGWDGLAVGEAHGILPDPYAVLALAAVGTTKLKLGTAVAVPLRHPMLAAGAMATLQGISRGRTRFSLGRGDGAVKVLQQKPMPVSEFEVYVRQIQGYLRREQVEIDGKVSSMARMFVVDPSLDVPKVPIDIAATGPKTIEVAARTADSVSFSVGADVDRLRHSMDLARRICEEVGRDFDELELGCYLQIAVVDDDDDSAREAIRGLALTHARFSGFEAKPTSDDVSEGQHREYRHALETMEKVLRAPQGGIVHSASARPGELVFYPPEAATADLIERFAIVGPPERCARRLQEIVDLGLDRIWIGTKGVGVDLDERNAERVAGEVLPLIRR